jgi:hypothetical protein
MKAVDIDFKNLLYWGIIDYLAPASRDDLKEKPKILYVLKQHIQ